MFVEEDLLPISALQHLIFCPRQCALIHLERLWSENVLTVTGQHLHQRAHSFQSGWKENVYTARSLKVRSLRYGLFGQTDVVDFVAPSEKTRMTFQSLISSERSLSDWEIVPCEYKRGRPKKDASDRVQLCAQAICLEEMLAVEIPVGFLFYGKRRRKTKVLFDRTLRNETVTTIDQLHALIRSRETPPAVYEPKCDACSLFNLCLPKLTRPQSASVYLDQSLSQHLKATGPTTDLSP
ncbi:CRISPR-associated exonuclease Cas4 [Planctomycetales bacterium 10988]|nr:CRISPR-associated exonuclease Cas4 [Planctomycetales bacterium 10988]